MVNVLYVFGGEKASGAEKVIERMVDNNLSFVNPHLFVSPGEYGKYIRQKNAERYPVHLISQLAKLNRSAGGQVKFYWRALSNCLKVSYKVLKYIKANDISLIHANTVVPTFYLFPAIIYSRIFSPGRKFIWSDHDLKYFGSFDTRIALIAYKLFDLTLTVSDAVKRKYPESPKVKTLYNGIRINELRPDVQQGNRFKTSLGLNTDGLTIGMAGTIERRKGQLGLIEACRHLSHKNKKITLLLAGPASDDEQEYLAEVKRAADANESILYLGKITDMYGFYNACDIIVSNSNKQGSEPLGTTIYEAMAVEKVVVASNTGGTPEIINDRNDGFLFKCDDLSELILALEEVTDNYGLLEPLRKEARQKVADKFNVEKMAANYNVLIKDLLR